MLAGLSIWPRIVRRVDRKDGKHQVTDGPFAETKEFQKTFWSSGFGMAVDRFGIPWMVNCEQAA
jgi:uncharacterized glyoxalase superfamily protein PhnB